ncbi:GMP/IMP nucleotidase [Aliikangiella coralliicola]|uniref:GMP/IMP nucleotidase n=1 Tax=Aliikangiella coralliicola TaxID=2592383 RepID=A0A545U7P7_9GAMM|nr:GMP/IMP nucleotidase [Aliikangiella coralliicola]TQV85495.1 GMP/IMP nucleotidase [Aliikangiella coralliicola]
MEPKINWSEIDTVLLDMDGTILDLGFDNYFWLELLPKVYAEKNQLTLEQSKTFLAESYGAIEGKLQWYCLDFWSERLQLDIPELKKSVKERVAFRPGAVEFLQFLVDEEKSVYLVTNAHPKSLEIKLLNASFHQYFCDLHSSHEFGYPKEEQEYWRMLKDKYQFNPQRALFVDDNVRILKSARQFGIKHLLGIKQPDLSQGEIDCSPFQSIGDFTKIIQNA